MIYDSVVSCDSIIIYLLIYDLNNIYILSGKIQKAHLNAPTKERVLFYAGDKRKSYQGRLVLIVRDIYGLN